MFSIGFATGIVFAYVVMFLFKWHLERTYKKPKE